MNGLSVAIVACNEAENIRRALERVKWADEIVLVDSGSTDGTLEIAAQYGAKIFHEEWEGYGRQVNRALDRCTRPWVLNIDADEEVSPELATQIRAALNNPKFQAYWISRSNQIFGRWMRHGGLYPDYKLRLFRRGTARLREDTEPHATPKKHSSKRKAFRRFVALSISYAGHLFRTYEPLQFRYRSFAAQESED